jgi:hypothetical protein
MEPAMHPSSIKATMEPAMHPSSIKALWADALFASALQRGDRPSAGQARQAVAAAVGVFGPRGCAERVAQEFGDHPESAVTRMRWARAMAAQAMVSPGNGGPDRPDEYLMLVNAHR